MNSTRGEQTIVQLTGPEQNLFSIDVQNLAENFPINDFCFCGNT